MDGGAAVNGEQSHWSDTESVLVRLGLVDPDGQPIEPAGSPDATADARRPDATPAGATPAGATSTGAASTGAASTGEAVADGTVGERPAVFPIGAAPHPITIAEPVPTFDALVARTRARARADDEPPRPTPSGPLGPAPEPIGPPAEHPLAPRLARALPGRRFVQRLLPGRPSAQNVEPRASESPAWAEPAPANPAGWTPGGTGPVPVDVTTSRPAPSGSTPAPIGPAPTTQPSGLGRTASPTPSGPAPTEPSTSPTPSSGRMSASPAPSSGPASTALPARPSGPASAARPSGPVTKRPRRRLTPAQWRTVALVAAVVAVLAIVAVPAAVLSWRSALGDNPNAVDVLGGGLGVAGFVLLATGALKAARADAGEKSTQSLPALLARPGALPVAVGVALLLCAALTVN
ncbi:hypothetical protein [Cryptosporangium minutisporangium]|uniref:hypothetical protein n=1 Tax=Cryptosporangium minutisporangium TaxID=113569 RepID=UPI0035EC8576